jgi:hypothetical protein
MAKRFIAICDNMCGNGGTLESAFEELMEFNEEATIQKTHFYEAEQIGVEMKILKKEIPVQVNKLPTKGLK